MENQIQMLNYLFLNNISSQKCKENRIQVLLYLFINNIFISKIIDGK